VAVGIAASLEAGLRWCGIKSCCVMRALARTEKVRAVARERWDALHGQGADGIERGLCV
jgi:hypothetical protein